MATEQRLIDANALALDFEKAFVDYSPNTIADKLIRALRNAPTVDAVEVVRCKDCARCKKGYCTIRKDSWGAALLVGEHDFCSDGERKEK